MSKGEWKEFKVSGGVYAFFILFLVVSLFAGVPLLAVIAGIAGALAVSERMYRVIHSGKSRGAKIAAYIVFLVVWSVPALLGFSHYI